jgi:hypothetical protein
MNTPLFIAGLLALVAAAVHGVAGELLVVRKLWQGPLPSTRFGGAGMTRSMIHATWHITSFAFLVAGVGMIVSATALDGDAADVLAWFTAAAFTGYAAVAVVLGAAKQRPRAMLQHPGPVVLGLTAALAWWGAL